MIILFHLKLDRQILLNWGYELVENNLLWFFFCSKKWVIFALIEQNYCKKQMIDIIIVEEGKKLLNIILQIQLL